MSSSATSTRLKLLPVALLLSVGIVGLGFGPTAVAEARTGTSGSAQTLPTPWSISHGDANASGTKTTTQESGEITKHLTITGSLSNSSADCFSLWIRRSVDLAPGLYSKVSELCGTGSTPVQASYSYFSPLTTIQMKLCRGAQPEDCATPIRLLG